MSGQVTPDNFVVNKVTHEIIEKQLANKDFVLVSKGGGGMVEQPLDDPHKASLTDAQVIAITAWATKVEAHYKLPMDIEWAYADGKLYLLQARPITTYVPLPEIMITQPGAEKYLYLDMIVLSQGFQESLSVLGNEIWGAMLETIKGDIGLFDRGTEGAVLNIEGRQYVHVSNAMKGMGMRAASALWKAYDTPTRKIIESINLSSYMPAQTPEPMRGLMWQTVKYAGRSLMPMLGGLLNPEKSEKQYNEMVARDVVASKQLATQEIPFRNLVDQYLDLFAKQMDASLALLGPSLLARQRLSGLFKNDDVDDLLVALQIDLNGNPTSEMGHLMLALAKFPGLAKDDAGEYDSDRNAARLNRKECRADYRSR